jgi:hypothetical protein
MMATYRHLDCVSLMVELREIFVGIDRFLRIRTNAALWASLTLNFRLTLVPEMLGKQRFTIVPIASKLYQLI